MTEVGVQGYGDRFSLSNTATIGSCVRLVIYTDRDVKVSSVLYGGVPMTCTEKRGRHARQELAEHHYALINVPHGTNVITGHLSEQAHYVIRRFEDTWDYNR